MKGASASISDLRALARGLRVPLSFFVSNRSEAGDFATLFRANASTRPDLGAENIKSFVEAALQILPPRSNPPEWLSALAPTSESYQEAARLADSFRCLFVPDRLDDSLPDLPQLLVNLGGVVIGRLESSRFEGASVIADGYGFIFISPRFIGRMLFTLAHELGHLIAHHASGRAVVLDSAKQINARRPRDKSEAFVDAFASVLLLPARGVALALKEIRKTLAVNQDQIGDVELLYLARFYGVSFDVAARRAEALELLPPGGAASLNEHLTKTYGSPERRAASLGLPNRATVEFPRLSPNLLEAAVQKIDEGVISTGWVTDRFNCTISDIYAARAALGAHRGYHH
jgi:Zn-dependent peptidase ImmA (M78 family)